jgi:L-fuculose-phosphate aldolase
MHDKMRFLSQRQEVLAAAREISAAHLVIGTWGNVSLKIKDEPLVLITPSGMNYQTMVIEDIVLIDLSGSVVEGKWRPSSESLLHTVIYQRRPDLGAIVHVHSVHATAFAAVRKTIPVILEETAQVIGHPIVTAPYAASGTRELAVGAAETLGNGSAVLLANHGLVGVGKNLRSALRVCYITEETAQVACIAAQLGTVHELTVAEINDQNKRFSKYGQEKKTETENLD